MSIERLHYLERKVLFFLIIFLPITNMPKNFTLFAFGEDMSVYFLMAALSLTIYEYIKYKFHIKREIKIFFFIYIVWQFICLIYGIYTYAFYDMINLEQIPKLAILIDKLNIYGIDVNDDSIIKIWLILRFMKDILISSMVYFFSAFYVYHLYRDNFEMGFKDIRKAVLSLVCIMGIYSVAELVWLKLGIDTAAEIIIKINPLLYDPEHAHGWWPPLLWNGQLRSICAEPSYFSIISIFSVPILWSYLLEKRKRIWIYFFLLYFDIMIFATNARTAIVIVGIELLLLIFSCFFIRYREYVKKISIIVLLMLLAFSINLVNFRDVFGISDSSSYKDKIELYMENNLGNLTDTSARSNSARLANLIGNINVVKTHPIMGVGTGLKDVYIDNNLPCFAYEVKEVMLWHQYLNEKGPLKSGYPPLNKYIDVAIQNGIIGLIIYLVPVIYVLFNILKYKKIFFVDKYNILLLITLIGLLAAQMSNSVFIVCDGIIIGLLYCRVKGFFNNNRKVG